MGVRAHCLPGDELLVHETGHIPNYEQGAPAVLSGVTCRLLPGEWGMIDIPALTGKIRADNQHFCRTRLVCLENTANAGGGKAYPLEHVDRVGQWAHEHGLKVHMDGARLFNACIAKGYAPKRVLQHVDTVSICFSKGLGCPMGSLLAGSKEEIAHARRSRKLFGGALRQAGVVAATAIYALENHVERLAEDHANAKAFSEAIGSIEGIRCNPADIETNLVFFEVDPDFGSATQLSVLLKAKNVRINPTGPQRLRACTHLDVTRADVVRAAKAIAECLRSDLRTVQTTGAATGPYARG
jgi:threonine aldolase